MTVRIRQYFGATRRHPEPCVEASFPLPEQVCSLRAVADRLRQAGTVLPSLDASRQFSLPEAVGTLACAILGKPVPPRWSWGSDNATGWVCMTHALPALARAALVRAHAAITDTGAGAPEVGPLIRLSGGNVRIRPTTVLVMEAAATLGLSASHVSDRADVFQVGDGSASRIFYELGNQQDGVTGHQLSVNKLAALDLLRRFGLPTTTAIPVATHGAALEAVREIGFPCVIKPTNRGKGLGVTTRIRSEHEVADAVDHAARVSQYPVMVENHVEGHDHRMLVVDGKLLWVYQRTPPYVTGDGISTVETLIARENERRMVADDAYLKPIIVDVALERYILEHYGLSPRSILADGQQAYLAGQANLARGGTLKDVTSAIHPDNRTMAIRAASLFRISALGIDFLTPDISRSWTVSPSAIIEVNAIPGISGPGDACLALATMMPRRLSGKVPIYVVIGDQPYQQATREIVARALAGLNLTVGTCDYMRPVPPVPRVADPFRAARSFEVESLLLDPGVDALIVCSTPAAIEQHGFPVNGCDVIFAAARDMAALDYIRPLARQRVADTADAGTIGHAVLGVAEPYLGTEKGSARPVLELTGVAVPDADGNLSLTMRCWRVRALPRAAFRKTLPINSADADPVDGMIGRDDILTAVHQFAGSRLRECGCDTATIRFLPAASGRSWDTPNVDVAVSMGPGSRDRLLASLEYGVTAVNALIAGLD